MSVLLKSHKIRDSVNPPDIGEWWKGNATTLSNWARAAKKALVIQSPSGVSK